MHAARVAKYIKQESGLEVEIDSRGKIGEFTVWVDGQQLELSPKGFFKLPDKKKILAAVQQA